MTCFRFFIKFSTVYILQKKGLLSCTLIYIPRVLVQRAGSGPNRLMALSIYFIECYAFIHVQAMCVWVFVYC